MDRTVAPPLQPAAPAVPDLAQVKARQRRIGSSADCAFSRSGDSTMGVRGEYLEVVVDRR